MAKLGIFKAILNNIEKSKMERAKERKLVQLIEDICSDESEYAHGFSCGYTRFKELTPFLKPCPYCGGEVSLGYHNEMYIFYRNRYRISCLNKDCRYRELMALEVTPDLPFRQLSAETREKYMRQIIYNWNHQEKKK